jgi:hypothetical protein
VLAGPAEGEKPNNYNKCTLETLSQRQQKKRSSKEQGHGPSGGIAPPSKHKALSSNPRITTKAPQTENSKGSVLFLYYICGEDF